MTISEVSDMGEGNWILLRCPTGQAFEPHRDGHRFLLHASEGAGSWPSPIGDGSGGGHLAPVSPGGDAVAQPDGDHRQGQRFDLAPTSRAMGTPRRVGAGPCRAGRYVARRSDPDPRYLLSTGQARW